MIFVLVSPNLTPLVSANTGLNHQDMINNYPGYGQKFFETLAEESMMMNGRYSDTRDYVQSHIDNVKQWGSQYLDDLNNAGSLSEFFSANAGAAVSLTDSFLEFMKGLFKDDEGGEVIENTNPDCVRPLTYQANGAPYRGWEAVVSTSCGYKFSDGGHALYAVDNGSGKVKLESRGNWGSTYTTTSYFTYAEAPFPLSPPTTLSGLDAILRSGLKGVRLLYNGQPVYDAGLNPTHININRQFDRWRNDTSKPTVYVPVLKPEASCSDGRQLVLKPDGQGGFTDSKGNAISTDGCTVVWQTPKIEYIEKDGEQIPVVEEDGKLKDIETGETVGTIGDGEDGEDGSGVEGCSSVLCGIGKIISAITKLVTSILDGLKEVLQWFLELLTDLFKLLFVPAEDFWSNNFNDTRDALTEKLGVDELIEDVDSLSGAGGGVFQDIKVTLLGVSNLEVIDADSVNRVLENIHKWVRGVVFPFLLFYNINQLYKLIRGTSLVEATRNLNRMKGE